MEIQASLLVEQLKAQRNAALDETAMAVAQCRHLMEECAKLKELSDKQQVLLAEADKLMRDMSKEKNDNFLERQTDARMKLKRRVDAENLRPGKKRVRRTKAQMAKLNGKADATINASHGQSELMKMTDIPENYPRTMKTLRGNGEDNSAFYATEEIPQQ